MGGREREQEQEQEGEGEGKSGLTGRGYGGRYCGSHVDFYK